MQQLLKMPIYVSTNVFMILYIRYTYIQDCRSMVEVFLKCFILVNSGEQIRKQLGSASKFGFKFMKIIISGRVRYNSKNCYKSSAILTQFFNIFFFQMILGIVAKFRF